MDVYVGKGCHSPDRPLRRRKFGAGNSRDDVQPQGTASQGMGRVEGLLLTHTGICTSQTMARHQRSMCADLRPRATNVTPMLSITRLPTRSSEPGLAEPVLGTEIPSTPPVGVGVGVVLMAFTLPVGDELGVAVGDA